MPLTNPTIQDHVFLRGMYADDYFPRECVDKVKDVLVRLCEAIERTKPADVESLYRLTHAATKEINDLQQLFEDHDSEIETAARETIAENFAVVAKAYGFDADVEELIATRDW
jgi:hypothetical protein